MRAVALAIVLLLAGCTAAPAGPPASSTPPAPGATGSDIVLVGKGATEASFTFAPDGRTMLACSHGVFQRPSPVFLSEDAGASWRPLPVPAQSVNSGDCDVAVTTDGKTWLVAYDTIASAAVAASSDRGASWRVVEIAGLPLGGGVDRPWLGVAGSRVLLTWCDVMGVEPALCYLSASADAGASWSTATLHTPPAPGRVVNVMGDMTVAADGKRVRIPVAWADAYEPDADVSFTLEASDDAGATWRELPVAGPMKAPAQFTSASWGADGTLWTSYSRGPGGPSWLFGNVGGAFPIQADVVALASRDGGSTWSSPVVAASKHAFNTQATTWIAGAPDGSGLVAWNHDSGGGKWVVDAATVRGSDATVVGVWRASGERTSTNYVDYLVTGFDKATGRGLVMFVMDGDVLLARALQP
jgi:hypothetical protein